MAKYRLLTKEELETFEKEFVDYLVVNGIAADDWVKMKSEEPDKAEKIVDLFSDVIFEGVLRKVKFLELHTDQYIQCIQCLDEDMNTVILSSKNKSFSLKEFDLNKTSEFVRDNFDLHSGRKSYSKRRELEIFELTERGYQITTGDLFKSLILATV